MKKTQLEKIELGPHINKINAMAFQLTNILDITIDSNNTTYCLASNIQNGGKIVVEKNVGVLDSTCSNVIGCLAIGNLVLDGSIKKINTLAFSYCSGINKVDLSKSSVEEICDQAFYSCLKLWSIDWIQTF